jgi:hypothetical protein
MTLDGTAGITFPSGSGTQAAQSKVLQVVSAAITVSTQTSSTTYIDTGVSLSITPIFSTSKVLVIVDMTGIYKNTANEFGSMQLVRNSTALIKMEGAFGYNNSTAENNVGATSANYLDSPATTSSVTYKTQILSSGASANVGVGRNGATHTITLMEIAQ